MALLENSSWARMTWPEIAKAVPASGAAAILPLGATEQHGPHLGTGMDGVLAETICREAGARAGVPVLPPLYYGSSAAHSRRWPGTLALSPPTFIAVLSEIGDWLHASGVRRLFLVNAHVGNAGPAACALDVLRCRHDDLSLALLNLARLTPEIEAAFSRDATDWHANAAETSLMLAIAPDCVRPELCAQADDPDRTAGCVFAHPVNRTSRNGVTGRPGEATVEEGRRLYASLLDALTEAVTRGLRETPPLDTSYFQPAQPANQDPS